MLEKILINDSFNINNDDSFIEKLKSSKNINTNKLQKNKNKMPISIKNKEGFLISNKKNDNSKLNKTFIK